jgi:hypothetical protein
MTDGPGSITLAELLRAAMDDRQRNMHTALPGQVVSYDAATQTAAIELLIELSIPKRSGGHGYEQLPVLHGVPIGHSRGGGFVVHFPLVPGDHVWVMFAERSMDEVIGTGQRAKPRDLRMHDSSFAYAIAASSPSIKKKLEDMPDGALVIGREDDEARIRITDEGVFISASGDVSVAAGGTVSITADDGVVLSAGGDVGAVALADKVHAAISAMLAAGIGVAGTQAFAAAKVAWDAATLGVELPPGAPEPPAGLAPVGASKVTAE